MTTPTVRFACQTYSWQMSIDTYRGRIDHMTGVAAAAGFAGFEPEVVMLGEQWTPHQLSESLDRHQIKLAALVLVQRWDQAVETYTERVAADVVIETVADLPDTKIVLCPHPGVDRDRLRDRQRSAMSCMQAVADRAGDRGVRCTFHPNSPAGSVFRTAEDYQVMADLLPSSIGYTPDVGHIAKGGMDPLTVIRAWGTRVDHVHIKDMGLDGRWAPTGHGSIDIDGVLDHLATNEFEGWVTFEDESELARQDPDRATAANGDFIRDWRHRHDIADPGTRLTARPNRWR